MNKLMIFAHPLIYLLSLVMPKKKNVWVFGSWFGERYADNSKYLFEEIHDNHASKVRAIWITRDMKIYSDLLTKGYECYISTSLVGIYIQLRAKVFVCSINSKDFLFSTITFRNDFVQLWHGTPLKKINFDVFNGLQYWFNYIRSVLIDNYNYIISPSKLVDVSLISAFRSSKSAILRSAYPRCDGLFISDSDKHKIRERLEILPDRKLVLYLPTHRNDGNNKGMIANFVADLISIDDELSKLGIVVVVKPHFYDSKYLADGWPTDNICIIKDGEYDVNKLMATSDALLTDYSSVMFDYEVTNKPIVFYMPDIDTYEKEERGLYYKPLDVVDKFHKNAASMLTELKNISCGWKVTGQIKLEFNESTGPGNAQYLSKVLIKTILSK